MALFFSFFLSTLACAAIQVGDSANYKTTADIDLNGRTSTVLYTTVETVKAIDPDGTYEVETIENQNGKVTKDVVNYRLTDFSHTSEDPEIILKDCKKLGYKKISLTYKNQPVDGCDMVEKNSKGYDRVVIGRLPLYRVFWGGFSKDSDGSLKMSMVNTDVTGY